MGSRRSSFEWFTEALETGPHTIPNRTKIVSRAPMALAALLALALAFPCAPAQAADTKWEPELHVRTMYDDNILFTNTAETDDVVTVISPRLGYSATTPRSQARFTGMFDVIRYAAAPELDTLHHRYVLTARSQVSQRWALSGEGEYRRDSALDDELEETGRLAVRTDREWLLAGAGADYAVSERSQFGLSYRHTGTRYEAADHQDRDSDTVTASYERVLTQTRATLLVRPRYTHWETADNRTDDYGLAVGWRMPLRETFAFEGSAGGRYTISEREFLVRQVSDPTADTGFQVVFVPDSRRETNWGFTANVLARWTRERTRSTLGYRRGSRVTSLGETVESDIILATFQRRITPRLSAGAAGRLTFARSIGGPESDRSRYVDLSPSVAYLITETITLEAAHRYTHDRDDTKSPDPVSVRNQTWVQLKIDFSNWTW